ncbi:3-phosphoshikimate 1-carboxyvinyltransferase [Legionella waltersii]|uniref:3-phosphoshikimate 1-carboxyvinyltransferase n=1 Tax=Legionella waltersii TaxID=66969 RepID=A0A0W1ALQ3_9GAMM|nr:3-phosphoshikimate 1-carboxyvinyltransferase [Legionella waltersii]SNV04291.1 3-phosphoshikimate 1-carboxyvinyltransferase [Legionella waltersii]
MTEINFISKPLSTIRGEITVPGDKSISHRSLIFSSIAKGVSTIDGFLDGEDCLATLNAFKSMGVKIHGPVMQRIIIEGVGKHGLQAPKEMIDCGNSGTSIRLLAGLLAAQTFDSCLSGDESLRKRPMLRVSRPLSQMGADIQTCDGKPPIIIHGNKRLQGIEYLMPEASAQVKSCILLAGMYASGKTIITEPAVSRDHTERMLKTFSYPLSVVGNRIEIEGKGECKATELMVPGDISSAAFFIVAASIIPGANIIIRNVGLNPTRIGVIHILREMGAKINVLNQRASGEEEIGDLQIEYSQLRGITIPESMVSLAIDEFPILFIAAACAQGRTILHGARELRMKESDRIGSMVQGLTQLGVNAEGFEDGVSIQGGLIKGGEVDSFGDHRIAMSFAIAGAVASSPVLIKNCANVATSFPSFVSTANRLQFQIEELY